MTDYTILEASRELGAPWETVRSLVRRHGLGYKRNGSQTRYLSPADVDYIRQRLGKRGRPSLDKQPDKHSGGEP